MLVTVILMAYSVKNALSTNFLAKTKSSYDILKALIKERRRRFASDEETGNHL
jgi:hypothetical protein